MPKARWEDISDDGLVEPSEPCKSAGMDLIKKEEEKTQLSQLLL